MCADASATATVQEIHQVIVHLLCAAVDREVIASPGTASTEGLPDKESPGRAYEAKRSTNSGSKSSASASTAPVGEKVVVSTSAW